MFDIGFTELLLIAVVALIVLGPERLPSLIRAILSYVRQFRASFSHIKNEVERELNLDNLKNEFHHTQQQINEAIDDSEVNESIAKIRQESETFSNFKNDFLADEVTDEEIEKDLANLEVEGPLPKPESEAGTGVEEDSKASSKDNPSKSSTSS